jgi:GNAT superfamily N-acetyltransferase
MQIRLELTPSNQPEKTVKEVKRLDKLLFAGDKRVDVSKSWVWIARVEGKPVAFGAMRACEAEANKGLVLFTRAGVLPVWRGKGIQKRLIRLRVRKAKSLGYETAVAYVMGMNCASSNALIGCGFRLYHPSDLYAGYRAVYLRKQLGSF